MKAIRRPDQYLRLRGDVWHYVRRVPKAVRHIDHRGSIYRSLDTTGEKSHVSGGTYVHPPTTSYGMKLHPVLLGLRQPMPRSRV